MRFHIIAFCFVFGLTNGLTEQEKCQTGEIKGISGQRCSYGFLVCCDNEWVFEKCPDGLLFDVTLGFCVRACKICTNGEIINSSNGSCDQTFQVCVDGEMKEEVCPLDLVFDAKLLYCIEKPECRATTAVASTTTTKDVSCYYEGSFKSVENCTQFEVCYDGKWVLQTCPFGMRFDTNLFCTVENNECFPTQEPTNIVTATITTPQNRKCDVSLQGDFKPASSYSCESKFLVCCDGEWKEETCPLDLVFDSKVLYCVQKPSECETTTTGGFFCGINYTQGSFKSVENCTQFEVCYDGKWILQSCPHGMKFDENSICIPNNDECIPILPNTTTSTTLYTSSPPNCHDSLPGAFKPASSYPCESKFLVCCDGEWKEQTCPLDLVFNSKFLFCVENSSECKPNITTESTTTATDDLICDLHYFQGSFKSVSDCTQFEVCYDGKWILQACPRGMRFDESLFCTTNNNECIPTHPTITTITTYKPSTSNCDDSLLGAFQPASSNSCDSKFLICCDGKWKEQTCPSDLVFSSNLLYCIEKPSECESTTITTEVIISTTKRLTCSPNYFEGSIKSVQNCKQFEVCYDGKWILQLCQHGMRFDENLICTPDNGECDPDIHNITTAATNNPYCDNSSPGAFKPASTFSCDSQFFVCCDGKWKEQTCPIDMIFNSNLLYCVEKPPDCELTTATSEVITNTTKGFSCGPEGSFKSVRNCKQFQVCYDGKWILQSCPSEMKFDENLLCTPDNGVCNPTTINTSPPSKCDNALPGALKPASTSFCDNRFLVCCDGIWKEETCPLDLIFNSNLLYCEEKPMECEQSTSTETVTTISRSCGPNNSEGYFKSAQSCNHFEICYDGKWILQSCPYGMRFDEKLICTFDYGECNPTTPPSCNDSFPGAFKPASSSLCDNSFYVCCDGDWQQQLCPLDMSFSPSLLYCISKPPECNIKPNCTPGTFQKIPDSICSRHFLVCCDNTWKTEICPNDLIFSESTNYCVSPSPECESCTTGTFRSILENCGSFEICTDNRWVEQKCPPNQIFKKNICVEDDGSCNSCANVAPGAFLPSRSNCSEFRICCDGYEQIQSCPPNLYFDATIGFCSLNTTCNYENYCTLLDEGRFEPIGLYQNEFRVCVNTVWIFQSCPSGLIFDTSLFICKQNKICDTGIFSADIYSINTFYVCVNGKFIQEKCPREMAFDERAMICSIEAKEGDLLPSKLSLNHFLTFQRKQWIIKNCEFGSYFDKTKLICSPFQKSCQQLPTGFIWGLENCNSFKICIAGKIEERLCPQGMKFDKILNICVSGIC